MTPSTESSPRVPRRPLVLLAVLAGLALLPGCALFIKNPVVGIVDVRVAGLGLTGGTAELQLQVENPNRFDVTVREFTYVLTVADRPDAVRWDTLAIGVSIDTLYLSKRSIEVIPLRIPFRYSGLGTALRGLLFSGEIPYRVEGTVRARGAGISRQLPYSATGTLNP
jgi:LEA14-like dessication related protein